MSTGYDWEGGRYARRCLVRAMYLRASDAACLAWVRYNKLMFTFTFLRQNLSQLLSISCVPYGAADQSQTVHAALAQTFLARDSML